MEIRYKLPSGLQKTYLSDVEKKSGLKGDQIARLFGVVGRSYRDWKRGKFALPARVVEIFEKKFQIPCPFDKEKALCKWKEIKLQASRNGGIAMIRKYGDPGTPEGRRKGGKHAFEILRLRGIIPRMKPFIEPQKKSIELAEFVGVLLGDGHISKEQWSVTVNSLADKQYVQYIKALAQRLFVYKPGMFMKKDCHAIVLYGGGNGCIKYLQRIGLKIGDKIKQQVGVPDWIKKDLKWKIACLRGLMDTDGGIFLHRYTVNEKEYVYTKLSFSNRSIPLIDFVYDTLEMVKLRPKRRMKEKSKQVWLYNQREVDKYLETVGTHNLRLLKNVRRDAGEVKRESLLNF